MRRERLSFDIDLWSSCSSGIYEHIHELIASVISEPNSFFYRGGFGRREDYKRLLRTGSDYEDATVVLDYGIRRSAVYATSFERVGKEPWCRGLDPLFWALLGHRGKDENWNPVNALVVYSPEYVQPITGEIVAFSQEKPTSDSIERILLLDFDKRKKAFQKY